MVCSFLRPCKALQALVRSLIAKVNHMRSSDSPINQPINQPELRKQSGILSTQMEKKSLA